MSGDSEVQKDEVPEKLQAELSNVEDNISLENEEIKLKMLQLDEEKEKKLKESNLIEKKKSEMQHLVHFLNMEKNRYNRHVRSVVRGLQQEILLRGKNMALELDNVFDEKIAHIQSNFVNLDEEIRKCKEIAHKVVKSIGLGSDEFMQHYDDIYRQLNESEPLKVEFPEEEVFEIGTCEVMKSIENMKFERKVKNKVGLPRQDITENVEKEVTVLGQWPANSHPFYVCVRDRADIFALHEYSAQIRKAYIKDQTWCTFAELKVLPSPGSKVFGRIDEDKSWCRGKVIEADEVKNVCQVLFVDWGHVAHVPTTHLLPAKEELYTDVEPYAFECVLTEDVDPKTSREARWWFNTTVNQISSAGLPITCFFQHQVDVDGRQVWLVDMKALKPDGETLNLGDEVKEKLIEGSKKASSIMCTDIREEFAKTKTVFIENPKSEAEQKAAAAEETTVKQEVDEQASDEIKNSGVADDGNPSSNAPQLLEDNCLNTPETTSEFLDNAAEKEKESSSESQDHGNNCEEKISSSNSQSEIRTENENSEVKDSNNEVCSNIKNAESCFGPDLNVSVNGSSNKKIVCDDQNIPLNTNSNAKLDSLEPNSYNFIDVENKLRSNQESSLPENRSSEIEQLTNGKSASVLQELDEEKLSNSKDNESSFSNSLTTMSSDAHKKPESIYLLTKDKKIKVSDVTLVSSSASVVQCEKPVITSKDSKLCADAVEFIPKCKINGSDSEERNPSLINTNSEADKRTEKNYVVKKEFTRLGCNYDRQTVSAVFHAQAFCYACHNHGHLSYNCSNAEAKRSFEIRGQNKDECWGCQKKGHKQKDCPSKNKTKISSLSVLSHKAVAQKDLK